MRATKAKTYNNNQATENNVPQQVLFPVELGVRCFKLACVLIDEVCIHHNAQLWPSDKEASHKSPYLRWEFEDLEVVEVEPRVRENAEMDTNRRQQDSGRESPAIVKVRGL